MLSRRHTNTTTMLRLPTLTGNVSSVPSASIGLGLEYVHADCEAMAQQFVIGSC